MNLLERSDFQVNVDVVGRTVKTQICATLGPISYTKPAIAKLMEAGMTVARLNFSHGSYEQHEKTIHNIREVSDQLGVHCAIVMDTRGPEIRIGDFENGSVSLKRGNAFVFRSNHVAGNENEVTIRSWSLWERMKPSDKIIVDYGLITFNVVKVEKWAIHTIVENSNVLGSNKHAVIKSDSEPMRGFRQQLLSYQDTCDIDFAVRMELDYIALSYASTANDVQEVRDLPGVTESGIGILAKISNGPAIENIDELIAESDGAMLCRSDMAVALPIEQTANVQKQVILKCNQAGKTVVVINHVLASMKGQPYPTRAEATDIANMVFDGVDCIALTSPTALGQYAVQSIETLCRICRETELKVDYRGVYVSMRNLMLANEQMETETDALRHSLASSAVKTSWDIEAAMIIVCTLSGHTAITLSQYRPHCLAEGTELLTDRGFMSLDDIIDHLTANGNEWIRQAAANPRLDLVIEVLPSHWAGLKVASFDRQTGCLVYEQPARLIVNRRRPQQRLVAFEGVKKDVAAGQTSKGKGGSLSHRARLLVTPAHDMYVAPDNTHAPFTKRQALKLADTMTGSSFRMLSTPTNGIGDQRLSSSGGRSCHRSITSLSKAFSVIRSQASKFPPSLLRGLSADTVLSFLSLYGHFLLNGVLSNGVPQWKPDCGAAAQPWLAHLQLHSLGNRELLRSFDAEGADLLADPSGWIWQLPRDAVRAIFHGLDPDGVGHFACESTALRDHLIRLAVHAGYAALFDQLAGPVDGPAVWLISYSTDNEFRASMPTEFSTGEAESSVVGRTWCLEMPHGFLIARHASRANKQTATVEVRSCTEEQPVSSSYLPILVGNCPVVCVTNKVSTARRLSLVRDCIPMLVGSLKDVDAVTDFVIRKMRYQRLLRRNDKVVITSGFLPTTHGGQLLTVSECL